MHKLVILILVTHVCLFGCTEVFSQDRHVTEAFSDGKTVMVHDSNTSLLDHEASRGRRPPTDALGVLKLKQFAGVLGITDRQEARIKEIDLLALRLRNEAYSGIDVRSITPEFIRETQRLIDDEVAVAIRDVLLPHQLERLKQTVRQMCIQSNGLAALTRGDLASELGLSDDQKAKLRKHQQEVDRELQKKLNQLRREEYMRAIGETLSSEQFEKLKTLLGSDVVFGPDFDPFGKDNVENVAKPVKESP